MPLWESSELIHVKHLAHNIFPTNDSYYMHNKFFKDLPWSLPPADIRGGGRKQVAVLGDSLTHGLTYIAPPYPWDMHLKTLDKVLGSSWTGLTTVKTKAACTPSILPG